MAIVLTRGSPSPLGPPTPEPTLPPAPEPTSCLQGSPSEMPSDVSFDGGTALADQSTPQHKAAKWLARNANLDDHTDKQRIQRCVLATLCHGANGNNWTTNDLWLDDGPECGGRIPEIKCASTGEARLLGLTSNNLQGSIPPELGLPSDSLDSLNLGENKLTGTVPRELKHLALLTSVQVTDNLLSGTMLTELGLLNKISFLDMADNQFSGTIPTELFLLTDLQTLRLGGNLQGSIPPHIGNLVGLSKFQCWV